MGSILGTAYVLVAPALEQRQLVELAASRSIVVFGAHGSVADFEAVRPLLEAAFREAQSRGAKVLFIQELGTVGWPDHARWKGPPPANIWLDEIERMHPTEAREWYGRAVQIAREQADQIAAGQLLEPEIYEQDGGAFQGALDRFLVTHRSQLAGVFKEDLQWEDYVTDVRYQAEVTAAIRAFVTGNVDEVEARMLAADQFKRDVTSGRDGNLVRQIGRLVRDRQGCLVVTYRGELHWPMVAEYRLKGRKPAATIALDVSFGVQRLHIAAITGKTPLPAEGQRLRLIDPVCRLLQSHFVLSGRYKTTRDSVPVLARLCDDSRLTVQHLRELSVACGGRGVITDPEDPRDILRARLAAERFVYSWLVSRSFLSQ